MTSSLQWSRDISCILQIKQTLVCKLCTNPRVAANYDANRFLHSICVYVSTKISSLYTQWLAKYKDFYNLQTKSVKRHHQKTADRCKQSLRQIVPFMMHYYCAKFHSTLIRPSKDIVGGTMCPPPAFQSPKKPSRNRVKSLRQIFEINL